VEETQPIAHLHGSLQWYMKRKGEGREGTRVWGGDVRIRRWGGGAIAAHRLTHGTPTVHEMKGEGCYLVDESVGRWVIRQWVR
jgi:hypothetical protein